MKISKESWHYRLMKWAGITDPTVRTNLCSYMRGIFLTITIPTILIYLLLNLEQNQIFEAAIIVVIFDIAILVLLGYAILSNFYSENIKHVLFPNRIKRKEPNVFIEWLKAKKQKICPMIEFTNDKPAEY
jgi:hypothetical protein